MTQFQGNPDDEQLVRELAQSVLQQTAPEELLLFDETAAEYFADPPGVLDARGRDEPVGFGLELAMVTPVVLAALTPVVQYLLAVAADALKVEVRPVVVRWVRALLHHGQDPGETAPTPALTPAQAARVRQLSRDRAVQLGMSQADADLLADSVVGGMAVLA
ncbi:MAG: hypothetical protein WCF36_12020 [Candidatus Nanopelagicales bacterium]